MDVNNVNFVKGNSMIQNHKTNPKLKKNEVEEKGNTNNQSDKGEIDVYEPEVKDKVSTETAKKMKYVPDKAKITQLANEAMQKTEQLKTLVTKLFNKQGATFEEAFSFLLDGKLVVDEETRIQAQKDISEDGYYGVRKTSERILNFAKALSGGDPSKIDLLKDAVIKGFKEVEKMWGKKTMPEITKETYDAVMKGFDEWEKGVNQSNKDSLEQSEI